MDHPDSLLGQLQRGRGAALRALMAGSPARAADHLLRCIMTLDRSCDLVTHVAGYVDLIAHHRIDLHEWQAWLSAVPAEDPASDRLLFQARLLAAMVERRVPGSWEHLSDQLLAGANWRHLMCESRELLPAETWLTLLDRMSDAEVVAIWDKGDPVWFRLSRLSARVRRLLPDTHRTIGVARRPFSPESYSEAPLSQSRFACLRDALMTNENVEHLLVEGLWDANERYRLICVDLVGLEDPAARDRVIELETSTWRAIAHAATRRLRGLAWPRAADDQSHG